MAFVASVPPADPAGPLRYPARLRPTTATTSTHGSLALEGFCCPFRPCDYDPIRQSRWRSLASQETLGYTGSPRPTTWSGLPPRPSLLWARTLSTRAVTPTPGGDAGPYPRSGPAPMAFLIGAMSRLLQPPTPVSVGTHSRRCSVRAVLRPACLLALLDRSDLERHRSLAAEDFVPELSRRKVALPVSRASLHGTFGGCRDRTFTGQSPAVTGCTLQDEFERSLYHPIPYGRDP